VVGKLLTQGLIEEIPARGALPIWRRDEENGAVALRITRRGLAAIRIDEHRAFLETQEPAAPGKRADPTGTNFLKPQTKMLRHPPHRQPPNH
jgi:hypothetical protein